MLRICSTSVSVIVQKSEWIQHYHRPRSAQMILVIMLHSFAARTEKLNGRKNSQYHSILTFSGNVSFYSYMQVMKIGSLCAIFPYSFHFQLQPILINFICLLFSFVTGILGTAQRWWLESDHFWPAHVQQWFEVLIGIPSAEWLATSHSIC